jgi:radical SAM superfamily enzyme YgiQ (UPF0313 family)
MLGIPNESKEDLKKTYQLIKEIKPEIHSPTYFTPVPGSLLYNYCKEKNLIKINSFENYDRRPDTEKIKGIDYEILKTYKQKMIGCSPRWFQEKHYAKLAIIRWLYLIKKGSILMVISEFILRTFLSGTKTFEYMKFLFKKIVYNR